MLADLASGEKMRKLSIALPALAALAALAITPAAMADSYLYTINGSNFSANLYFVANPNSANGVYALNTDTITSVSGSFTVGTNTYTLSNVSPVLAQPGSDASNPTDNGAFLYDNLLYPAMSGNKILDWDGLLIDVPGTSGYELNLFSGAFGGIPGNMAPGNMYFYFADNGSNYSDNPINVGNTAQATLVATPEPGSLLLLGSGLLGLAFLVFQKGRPSGRLALHTQTVAVDRAHG